jgi:hypothetical protein
MQLRPASDGGLRCADRPSTRPQYSDIALDSRPHYSYLPKIPLAKDAFREGDVPELDINIP